MIIEVSLENRAEGHAFLNSSADIVTIFLPTLTELLGIPREFFPFNTIEELLEELVIHELIHKFTRVREDYIIDSWHKLVCQMMNSNMCMCPIPCYYRDILSKKK